MCRLNRQGKQIISASGAFGGVVSYLFELNQSLKLNNAGGQLDHNVHNYTLFLKRVAVSCQQEAINHEER